MPKGSEGGFIRFVGGPEHNRHRFVPEWHPFWEILRCVKPLLIRLSDMEDIGSPSWIKETYLLHVWRTEFGTTFYEYLHGSHHPEQHVDDPWFWPPNRRKMPWQNPHLAAE